MDNNTYIDILADTLAKKSKLLDELIKLTETQAEYIQESTLDMDKFDLTLHEKDELINYLNQIDDGFEKIYEHVQDDLSKNKLQQKERILKLQELIKKVTEKSTKLQSLEKYNRDKLELYFSSKKNEIKNYKMNSQSVSSYYKNMGNQYQGESYFLDKKK